MSTKYLKIKPSEDFSRKYEIRNFEIEYVSLFSRKKEMQVFIKVNSFNADSEIQDLRQLLYKNFESEGLKLRMKMDINSELIKKDVVGFIKFAIESYKCESQRYQYIFASYEVENLEDTIFIKLPSHHLIEEAKRVEIKDRLTQRIHDCVDNLIKIEFVNGDFKEIKEKIKAQNELNSIKSSELPQYENSNGNFNNGNSNSNFSNGGNFSNNNNNGNNNGNGFRRKQIPDMDAVAFSALDILNDGENVALEGKIFNLDMRETKNGKLMCDFMITDYTNSVSCRIFFSTKKDVQVKLGDWVKVTGTFESDMYTGEKYIRTQKVEAIDSKDVKKEDNAPKKRIELHAHTNMSEMNGVMSIKDYAKRAKEFGHSGIAVTDYGVVHSFPFAFKEANEDFKVIFGMEAYVVDDEQDLITNPKNKMIEDEIYVVFDIETTGFDPFNDKIIEIGAVKMRGREVIGEFSEFVNPEIPIPKKITELTTITNEMVANAEKIETVLPRFLEFCTGPTVVAHNAKFDVGFIKQKTIEQGLEYSPSVIDTLPLARTLLPELRGYGLANLVKYFGITLETHHRAVDDAKATAEVFQKFLNMILSKGILKLIEINTDLQPNIQNSETLNTMILVKNQAGLRDLYELVSRSHIEFFGKKRPRIPKSLLNSMRENLLIASSASASERNRGELVNLYLRGTEKDDIEEKAKFYDYIEIQPVANYTDRVEKRSKEIENYDIIREMNKYFCELGKKLNKIVVATGDTHYLEEREVINRNVLLLGSGTMWKTEVAEGVKEYEFFDRKLYFKTTEEMLEEFKYLGEEMAQEVVVENTHRISDMIEQVRPIPTGFYPPKIEGAEDEVRKMTYSKLKELYGENIDPDLKERVEKELNSIIQNGFAVLYLIAQKLVHKSVDAGYLVGSRGSVGSSIVAYLMGITEVNGLYPHYRCPKCKHTEFMNEEGSGVDYPDKNCPECGTKYIKDGHAIPFEVFMGFDGDKVPDIDLNFSGEYQGEIHKYTEELFGSENVFRAGTISTLAEKNAFGYVKKYLEAIEDTTEIKERRAEVMRIAKGCEGARKTTGQHPGGMVVIPRDKSIYDFCPVQRPANDMKSNSLITHFDYHVMDEQLVKLDILGHDDPTMLKNLGDLTGIDIYKLPLDDKNVLSLFSGTEVLGVTPEEIGCPLGTSGIPEFGTTFVKQMLIDTRPKTFAELVRISGLSHGTDVWLNNAQDYVREGTATLSEIISVRDDIMNRLIDDGLDKSSAFSIMEFVRKGQPTKNPEKWKEYSALMKEKGVKQWYIDSCEKIKYMFPKAHATAYVIMGVRIAYFKVYYPLEFYTAFLNRKTDAFKISTMFRPVAELKKAKIQLETKQSLNVKEKQELFLYEILIEMYYRGIELEMVDIYKSDAQKFIIDNGKIRMPLSAVDGLGENVAIAIEKERSVHEFSSIEDLKRRTKITKTVISIMDMFDCFDKMEETDQMTLF